MPLHDSRFNILKNWLFYGQKKNTVECPLQIQVSSFNNLVLAFNG